MSSPPENGDSVAHAIDEVEVTLRIEGRKIIVESTSGSKGGSIELSSRGPTARLILHGSGSDRAVATLSGPELANLRTVIDSVLSTIHTDNNHSPLSQGAIYAGHRPLRALGGDVGVTFEADTLQQLGLVDDSGSIPGGSRQVRCTVLGSGTALINLAGSEDPGFSF